MRNPLSSFAAAFLIGLSVVASAAEPSPVTLERDGPALTLDNGVVRMEISKGGKLTGLHHRDGPDLAQGGYWNCNANGYDADSKALKHRFAAPEGTLRVVRKSADLVELAFEREASAPLFFDATLHYVLRRGDPGFYVYMTLSRDAQMPPAFVTQYAYNLRLNPDLFDYIAVDDERRHISHSSRDEAKATSIMDATYRLSDGRVVSKYNYTHAIEDDDYQLYGWAGPTAGVWWIQPSAEYYGSAPFRVLLTSHQTAKSPILIWQAHCTHRGGRNIDFPPGDTAAWSKVYGPAFVYLNAGEDRDAMWQDAKARVGAQEDAWPYAWMDDERFPLERGTIRGSFRFDDGLPAANAWAILSPIGTHWSKENRGYHFWARCDAEGRFQMRQVRPGRYALSTAGGDEFYSLTGREISVSPNLTDTFSEWTWPRVRHGKRIWQIGTADRSTGEFANGEDFHDWGTWRRYPTDFPKDVRFTIGESEEARDWNFIHWNWYSRTNAWAIAFELEEAPQGNAVLTFGIAGARGHGSNGFGSRGAASLEVSANGRGIGGFTVPSTGGDCYRSQRQSTRYTFRELRFDAETLQQGRNVITLRHTRADAYAHGEKKGESGSGPGGIMYDAIRLEIE